MAHRPAGHGLGLASPGVHGGGAAQLDVRVWGTGVRAVLVHGSLTSGEEEWEGQRSLANDGYRLVVPDRRGYGQSPTVAGEDFIKDGEDVAELLGEGAHLVGHSYGGLAALVAADSRPEAVLSLTLMEPPAFGLCADHPAVASLVADLRSLWARAGLPDREFLEAFLRLVGEEPQGLPDEMLETLTQRVHLVRQGRLPWEPRKRIQLGRLARSSIPTLIISGDHHAAWNAVCDELTRRLDARAVVIRGAGHEMQTMTGSCNRALLELWGNPSGAQNSCR